MIIKHNGAVLLIQLGKKQYKVINVLLVTEKLWFEELMETIAYKQNLKCLVQNYCNLLCKIMYLQ